MTKKIKYHDPSSWYIYKDNIKIPPIVSEEIWNLANKRLQLRKKCNNTPQKYNYSQKIYCSSCHKTYYRRIYLKNKTISWVCSSHIHNKCNNPSIRENELNTIINYLTDILNINKEAIIKELLTIYKSTNEEIDITLINKYVNKVLDNIILNTIIKEVNSITVSSNNNKIVLNIIINNLPQTYQKEFIFKRGYDSISTKRYSITYQVNYTSYQ